MMEAIANPFRPGYAVAPRFLAGREPVRAQCEGLLRSLSVPGYGTPRSVVLFGPRGNGKTSLLVEAGFPDWAADLAVPEGGEAAFQHVHISSGLAVARRIGTLSAAVALRLGVEEPTGKRRALLARFPNLSARLDLTAEGGLQLALAKQSQSTSDGIPTLEHSLDVEAQLQLLLLEGPLLLTIDEAYGMEPAYAAELLSAVSSLCSASERKREPETAPPSILLVLAGTPEVRSWLRNLRTEYNPRFGATFWDRCEKVPLGRLAPHDAAAALVNPLASVGMSIAREALDAAVEEAQGYPFFLQHLGSGMFDAARRDGVMHVNPAHLAAALPVLATIRTDYYGERWEELRERGLVDLSARMGEYLLAQPSHRVPLVQAEAHLARILLDTLGMEQRTWRRLVAALKPRAVTSALAKVENELNVDIPGEPMDTKAWAYVAEQAAIVVTAQLGDVGFLWQPVTGQNVELGIPSLAAFLLAKEAEQGGKLPPPAPSASAPDPQMD